MTDTKNQRSAAPVKQGGLNAEIQARIGHQLRAMYDDVVKQGVPDRFSELLKQLDNQETDLSNRSDPSNASDTTDGRD